MGHRLGAPFLQLTGKLGPEKGRGLDQVKAHGGSEGKTHMGPWLWGRLVREEKWEKVGTQGGSRPPPQGTPLPLGQGQATWTVLTLCWGQIALPWLDREIQNKVWILFSLQWEALE